jgi:uncharacterized membrane protein
MVLALVCVGLLLLFIHHISQAISLNHIVDRIAEEKEGGSCWYRRRSSPTLICSGGERLGRHSQPVIQPFGGANDGGSICGSCA